MSELMKEYIDDAEKVLLHTYNRYQVVLEKGDGVYLEDIDGKKYLDFCSGIGVFALGYNVKAYNDALKAQIDKITHTSNYYYNIPAINAAKKLTKFAKMDRVFFTNSGAEAVEGAIKAAVKYAYNKNGAGDYEIIAMDHSFHGRTCGALAITGKQAYREPFAPLLGEFKFAEFNNLESVKALITDKTCAIIMETLQGEGGIYPASKEFIEGVNAICKEKDIVLILDEIQCGMGRTGANYAWHNYDVKPDIIIGCAGGGSNIGGLISPFAGEMLRGEADYQLIAVEPESCPSLTRGQYAYDYCDTGRICPLQKMYTLGSSFMPASTHAGGLRYHGMSAIVSELYDQGLVEARTVKQTEVFEAAQEFARVEGILPAPESAHAIKVAMDEAKKCKETGESKDIVFCLTGTGYFDMFAYQRYNDGQMVDFVPADEEIKKSLEKLPQI